MKLEGSVAIVTGGAGGLGAATVRQLVACGLLVDSIVRNPYLNGENIRLDGALRFTAR